ncbi:hypothetical protein GQ55_9G502500 [Panicum hallii var. hallii]|uniref:Uncharacterized protein n=1 Tax=Panicum hallii var. hallii TaxID=1504633 RepID=A0A2T7CDS0_9POAL|nr:hypothetical protein GQ55_9G502500 [Panicum hallii var. hallii]
MHKQLPVPSLIPFLSLRYRIERRQKAKAQLRPNFGASPSPLVASSMPNGEGKPDLPVVYIYLALISSLGSK